jgi:predicted ATPase
LEERLDAEPHARLRYFCSSYHQDSALFPFIDQLGRTAGFARDDAAAAKLEKLEALVAPAGLPNEDVALIADLMSLPAAERHVLPDLSPQRKKEKTLQALLRQLDGVARQQPVVIVFEDAHWIDPTSRELLDLFVEHVGNLPVLLIVTYRPEFQPPWIGQPQVSLLALNRLDRHARRVLVAQIAGGKALPEGVVTEIVNRTDGVCRGADQERARERFAARGQGSLCARRCIAAVRNPDEFARLLDGAARSPGFGAPSGADWRGGGTRIFLSATAYRLSSSRG